MTTKFHLLIYFFGVMWHPLPENYTSQSNFSLLPVYSVSLETCFSPHFSAFFLFFSLYSYKPLFFFLSLHFFLLLPFFFTKIISSRYNYCHGVMWSCGRESVENYRMICFFVFVSFIVHLHAIVLCRDSFFLSHSFFFYNSLQTTQLFGVLLRWCECLVSDIAENNNFTSSCQETRRWCILRIIEN